MSSDPIAIVGMSCRFAGCATPAALWEAILQRRNLLTPPGPAAELPIGQRNIFDRPYPTRLGQLGRLYACVPAMQHFPRQVNAGENQDLYFATQLAFDALTDAAIKPRSTESFRGSVRFGYAPPFNAATVNWLQHTLFLKQTMEILQRFMGNAPEASVESVRTKLLESLPAPNASSFLLGTGYRFASWIARECRFSGAATIMDAGMLTGAATIEDALDDLHDGRSDIALAGALAPPLSRAYIEGLSGEVPFSTRTELNPFSESPDGTIPGEGGGFLVLKRHRDALDNHDRIYALVRSVALGHAPEDDPSAILRQATEAAGIPPTTIGLIEANGSGHAAAERREIETIQRLWGEHKPGGPLVGIGSVKGNIGHTLRASMTAGVIKAALALYHRVLPPQAGDARPAAGLADVTSSAYLLREERPWLTSNRAIPRRAAVLGANFDSPDPIVNVGVAGRSAAVILEEETEADS